MNKRPLCLVCLCFLICIWLLEILGITYGGDPRKDQDLKVCAASSSHCQVSGEVYRHEIRRDGTSYLYLKSTILVVSTKQFSNYLIRVKLSEEKNLCIGNDVSVHGTLYEMPEATNPGQFDSAFYYRIQGIDGFVEAENIEISDSHRALLRDSLHKLRERAKILLTKLAPDQSGVLSAMLLGDKTLLEEETRENYQITGILHILAVSGTHLAVVSAAVYKILLTIGCGRRMAGSIAVFLMMIYGIFTGSSISVMRAVVMFGLSVGAELVGRTYDMLSALSLSAIFLLIEHPGYLYDSGFLLSFGAVLGLGLFLPVLGEKHKAIKGGIAVFLVQLPILQYYFYELPVFSLLVNLVVIPLVPIVLGSGIIGLSVGVFHVKIGRVLLIPAQLVLELYESMGKVAARIPGAVWITGQPSWWQILLYAGLLIGGVFLYHYLTGRGFAAMTVLAILVLSLRLPTGFQLSMLDVGQGDCLVLTTPSGGHYLIDGGSSSVDAIGKYRILPYLKSQGIARLEGIFVTHGDADHISGILEILEDVENGVAAISVERLLLPEWMETKEDQSLQQAALEAGVSVVYLEKGDIIRDGEVVMTVMHPDQGEYLEDENSGSLTIKVQYVEFEVLLTGDLCGEGEEKVSAQNIDCQVLKVAHHGSNSSTTEKFLKQVNPQVALISCGENNRYGHPAPEVVKRLQDTGVQILDTRACGAVTVGSDGKKIWVEQFVEKEQ